ncbi:phosphocholine cytidylyltransferase family protein [Ferribacterium limneticum]|uniref:phosphocholine cytidylyltransferase family protein n=1 Tax=Ferribacterium limneticum TaxID=76259 RepID=UPI001CFA6FF3|nr:NTP transferase domain-containing protein [Ferribacterium limneticum]UCV29293.1 NTP transferase domain-containing protein [Ferribacterium limneticum]UCV33212.1 NTP transferase domain-containing protein [Ferribacterium limneticum]
MKSKPTVVINAAGRGTRLGHSCPKCLVHFLGQPLIHWQLQTLEQVDNLVVVIGFQAEEVKRAVVSRRPDAKFIFNEKYASTGTASSLCLAARSSTGPVLSLDGDMLVHPDDLACLLSAPRPCIGLSPIQSNAPVLVEVERDPSSGKENAIQFLYQKQATDPTRCYEWTGLVLFDPAALALDSEGHVFQMITPLLPCQTLHVRCSEIDFPDELPQMEKWIATLIKEGDLHG